MANGLAEQKVLVLGCGAVGQSAISNSLSYGAQVTAYDIDSSKCRVFKNSLARADSDRITVETDIHATLSGHTLVVDATNTAGIISAEDISKAAHIGLGFGLPR
jgi:saccharopine dehydrogenase-like NADP-dependent oxidoreductase